MKFRKTSPNHYIGYIGRYYVVTYKRIYGHGAYTAYIGRGGEWLWIEGRFGSSLPDLNSVKRWAKTTITHYNPLMIGK